MLGDIHVVATDLDGTLLRSDDSIGSYTLGALERAARAGVIVVAVTARPPWLFGRLALPHIHAVAVCSNGAIVLDATTLTVLRTHLLDPDVTIAIADDLRAGVPDVVFGVERPDGIFREPGYRSPRGAPPDTVYGPIGEIVGNGVAKLAARAPGFGPDVLAELGAVVGDRAELTASDHGLIEIGPLGVTKATGLAEIVDDVGLDASVVAAAGDMPNDVPMLRWARVGVAVANAHPHVIAVADHVVASNDDDGVGDLITDVLAGHRE